MNFEERIEQMLKDIQEEKGFNPIQIFQNIAKHHILNGACLLVALKNAGKEFYLGPALEKMKKEGLRMPGAMCGLWGVCGAVASMGAALSILDETGPLSNDGTWGDHMRFTSKAIEEMGKVNGPRCCKRDAMLSFQYAIEYINQTYPYTLEYEKPTCIYSSRNQQCIKERCPFYDK
ncbi:MAG: DUF5714 domain-containing protein [Bacillota bacterium]|nr:DUF5714 domain-containing protein [Bacillota bacterium]